MSRSGLIVCLSCKDIINTFNTNIQEMETMINFSCSTVNFMLGYMLLREAKILLILGLTLLKITKMLSTYLTQS